MVSSHITTDLEKIADYIVMINNGRVLLELPKDELLYNYAIIKCGETDLPELKKYTEDILGIKKENYFVKVFIKNKEKAERNFKDFVVDRVSLDEVMQILVKGEQLCLD